LSKNTSSVKCQTVEGTVEYTYDSMQYIKLAWLTDSKGLRHLIVDSPGGHLKGGQSWPG